MEYLRSDGDTSCDNQPQIRLSSSTNGVITSIDYPSLHMIMSLDKDTIVGTYDDIGGGYDFGIMTNMNGAVFAASDLEGAWMIHAVVTGDSPDWQGWAHIKQSINSSGVSTCLEYLNSDGDADCSLRTGWTWSITSEGIVTVASKPSWHGTMNAGKSVVAITFNDGGGGYGLIIMSKMIGAGFSTADTQGTWMAHSLGSGDGINGWAHGQLQFNASGQSTCQNFLDAGGYTGCDHLGPFSFSVSSDGIVSWPGNSYQTHGVMSANKDLMIFTMSATGGTLYELGVMTKM